MRAQCARTAELVLGQVSGIRWSEHLQVETVWGQVEHPDMEANGEREPDNLTTWKVDTATMKGEHQRSRRLLLIALGSTCRFNRRPELEHRLSEQGLVQRRSFHLRSFHLEHEATQPQP
jgi:hypothetical protein